MNAAHKNEYTVITVYPSNKSGVIISYVTGSNKQTAPVTKQRRSDTHIVFQTQSRYRESLI